MLQETYSVFRRWLGNEYDLNLLNAVLGTAAGNMISGEPVWLMIVGGSASGKTEMARSLVGCGAYIVSTISSEGALLSATSKHEKTEEATGGILREIGQHGLLVLKDFTSILSMPDRTSRPVILAALREIHDGEWSRTVGVDGGKKITWEGRLGVVGACTTAWDTAYTAIATMGDRFIVIRLDSRNSKSRKSAGMQAMRNTGLEAKMRSELMHAMKKLLDPIDINTPLPEVPEMIYEALVNACDIAAMARTPTDHDYKGNVTYSHDPESPTRMPKGLVQMIRGMMVVGMTLEQAFGIAMRCIRDSIPPIRLECLEDLAEHSDVKSASLANRIQRPWGAVDKALQALHSTGLILRELATDDEKQARWHYNIRPEARLADLWTPFSSLGQQE